MAGTGATRGVRQRGNSGPRQTPRQGATTAKAVAVMPVDLWRRAHAAAEMAGMSLSGYLSELVARDELDPLTGAPAWAPDPQPAPAALPGLEVA